MRRITALIIGILFLSILPMVRDTTSNSARLVSIQELPELAEICPPEGPDGNSNRVIDPQDNNLFALLGAPVLAAGQEAVNTLRYTRDEVERIARLGFELARGRRKRLVSVDKANVLETSQLWRQVVSGVGTAYPDVAVEHIYVDYAAMRLVSDPGSIDVLLTENMFGDILSDEAAVLAGSLGLLPSASLGDGPGLFEPIHGSAPPLAGKDLANPIGTIASVALMLRYGLRQPEPAAAIERAINSVLADGARTRDIAQPGEAVLGTRAMAERIVAAL